MKTIGKLVKAKNMLFDYFGYINGVPVVFYPEVVDGINKYIVKEVDSPEDLVAIEEHIAKPIIHHFAESDGHLKPVTASIKSQKGLFE